MVREVSANEFVARLSAQDAQEVHEALASGMGVARYGGMNISYGRRGAVIEGLPPTAYGGAELGDFVSPTPTPTTMRSPLMDAVGGPPQIARIKTAPPHTEYPSVEFETRTSRHPRGDRDGFIDVQRPGRQQEELPQTQLSEEVASWRDHL